jgi:hypothetical protein
MPSGVSTGGFFDEVSPQDRIRADRRRCSRFPRIAQQLTGTLKKIKDTGTITRRHARIVGCAGLYAGDGKYVGFHTEMAEKIASDLQKSLGMSQMTVKLQPVTSQKQDSAGAERHRGPRVRLDHQQCRAPEGRCLRDDDVGRRGRIVVKASSPIKGNRRT